MFGSLRSATRRRFGAWRRKLALHWWLRDRDSIGFLWMLGIPIVALSLIVYFAYSQKARAQVAKLDAAQQRAIDLHCLAENIYFEARGEPLVGQYAVAEVTMNRVTSPDFPHTVCAVVHDRRWDWSRGRFVAHFSWTEFDTDTLPEPSGPAWDQAMTIATTVYDDLNTPVVPGALYYHATYMRPSWAREKRIVATIGNHVFYR